MAINTKEIAAICGVSLGTVDRALNNRSGINPETKRKILKVAQSMGYRKHLLARSLVTGRTMTLGLVIFDLKNRFFSQLVNAIEEKARSKGYFMYLTLTDKRPEVEEACISHLVDRQVDGMIVCSIKEGAEAEKYFELQGVPLVSIGNKISESIPHIGINEKSAMEDATKYVIKKGYRRIIYFSPTLRYINKMNIYAQYQRFLGYMKALEDIQLNEVEVSQKSNSKTLQKKQLKVNQDIETIVIDHKDFVSVLDKLEFNHENRTVILCSNDIYALDVLNYFKAKGISVSEDVGVMGFDNIDVLKYIEPVLSTVSYPIKEIAEEAVEVLINIIENGKRSSNIMHIQHSIVSGKSLRGNTEGQVPNFNS